MRILHVTKKYPNAIGGDATCVFYLEKEQLKKGHRVFILTTNCKEIIDGDNIYKFGLRDASYNWDRITAKRVISLLLFLGKSFFVVRKTKPDIIHTHSSDLGFIISLWAKIMRISVINTCHSISFPYKFLNKAKRYSEWFFLKFGFFDKIIAVDINSMKFFQQYGLKNYQYLHIAGVDIDEFDKIKRTIYLSDKHKYPKFIFVGRIDPLKGLDYLLRAAAGLKEHVDYFEVWIIGDGPSREELKKLSYELGVNNRIKFFNAIISRPRLIKMYCMADIFVLPSLLEGFPLTIMEAWAAGLAVIVTEVGGVSFFCKHRRNALLISHHDVNSLTQAMKILIDNEELRKNIACSGTDLIRDKYDWSYISKNLGFMYGDVLDKYKL